jgi:deoxyadenosine/deoxycytidine kinase
MRIVISGTHFIGKSTLIAEFIKKYPQYKTVLEPYYQLQDEKSVEFALEPSLDSLIEQLDKSIEQLNESTSEKNIIFDRCPVDFLAYALYALEHDEVDIRESEIAERLSEVKDALDTLDVIIFLPISLDNNIEYTEENPLYRKAIDKWFKKLYRDEILDIFPRYNHPKIIELSGDRNARLKKLEIVLKI